MISFGEKYHRELTTMKGRLFDDPIRGLADSKQVKNQYSPDINKSKNLEIKFPNHSSRDVFIFVWKAFTAKRLLNSSGGNN